MKVIYYAAPLFTDAERAWNAAMAARLRAAFPDCRLHLPQEFCSHLQDAAGEPDFGEIFNACREHLEEADTVVAVLDGADADSGTAWELGYAYARGALCFGLRSDWRPAEDGAANCMLSRSCRRVCSSIDALLACLGEARLPAASDV